MKSNTRLDSAVFHLTPTRTRCDLIVMAKGKKEKIASGLLNPFLGHLKTARDQIEKGGYSIVLEPEPDDDASWFTKGTVERFVRFVSTPEILERVHTVELEILQIQEAVAIQGSNDANRTSVEGLEAKHIKGSEGAKTNPDPSEEKAIVLYEPEAHQTQPNGQCLQEGNSKAQLLKVLENRKYVLRKEQGMAFARAVAAGFDVDQMAPLISFAECFGASRLMDACSKFVDLWKRKHETGQWVEIEESEALSGRLDLSAMNASGIVFSGAVNKQNDFSNESASENNEKSGERPPANQQTPISHQEYFQGQFPHAMFPSWPMHTPPGSLPMFPPYPLQGMPYYQAYPGSVPFFQPPYPRMEDSQMSSSPQTGLKRQSMEGRDGNYESESWEFESSISRSHDGVELDKEASQSGQSKKKSGRSGKKQSGMVVIRNINYITSGKKSSTGSDSESASAESETDGEVFQAGDTGMNTSKRSSKGKGSHSMAIDETNYDREGNFYEKETEGGHWQAFQSLLLKGADEESYTAKEGMFATENAGKIKRRQKNVDDPLARGGQGSNEIRDRRMVSIHEVNGNRSRLQRGSNDEILFSRGRNESGDIGDQMDIHFAEAKGRRVVSRSTNDDFIIGSREDQPELQNSLDPLSVNRFERVSGKLDGESSHAAADESFIVPFRSMSLNKGLSADRTIIDLDSELPSSEPKSENISGGIRKRFSEPDDMTLIPERGTEKRSPGCGLALDYEMHVGMEGTVSLDKRLKKAVNDNKGNTKKSARSQSSKGTSDTFDKKRIGGPIRKGKQSKTSPLEDARARAEKIRAFKADVQKMKKEKEEADLKRLEGLKLERQKRIAARCSSASAGSTASSMSTKKLTSKLSSIPYRGSKFSDSEPGSSSPLQRSKVRTSVGSTDSCKASKSSKLIEGSPLPGNRLTRSVPSLSEQRKESSGVTPESKATTARIRRLSEPRTIGNHSATSVKVQSANSVTKQKLPDGPDSKKISAIINLDKHKGATLPELNVKTPKVSSNVMQNKLISGKNKMKIDEVKHPATADHPEHFVDNFKLSLHDEVDDSAIVEKNIVVLENDKPSTSVLNASGKIFGVQNPRFDNQEGLKESGASERAAIPGSLLRNEVVDKDPYEVKTSHVESSSKFVNHNTAEKPYLAPYARVSSLEDPCTTNSDYCKAPPSGSGKTPAVKAYVSSERLPKVDCVPESLAKIQVKDSPKGLRRLLKFAMKSHSSSAGDLSSEPDNASVNGLEKHGNSTKNAPSEAAVHTLKNLISEDETSKSGTASQKSSRHFSLLSPFQNKGSEKKLAT